jgi:dihydroorotase
LLLNAAHAGRLSLLDIPRLTSRGPARAFNLSRKGQVAPGYDADLVLVDLNADSVLQKPWQTKCNWSPFEGWRVKGKIARVFLRGRQVMSNGEISVEAGYGQEVGSWS